MCCPRVIASILTSRIGSGRRTSPGNGPTQHEATPPAQDDRSPRIPEARHLALPRGGCVHGERPRIWGEALPRGGTFPWSDGGEPRADLIRQPLKTVSDEGEARKRGFPKGDTFKLLQRDLILVPEKQAEATFRANAEAAKKTAVSV